MDGCDLTSEILRGTETLERVSDGIVALDDGLRYTLANDRALELLGKDEEELLGNQIWDVFPDLADSKAKENIEKAVSTQQQVSFERYNEELQRWWEVRVYPEADGVSIYFTDVTDRKESRAELERTNRMLTALVENTSEAIYVKDVDGEYRMMNEAAADLFGMAPEEVVGKRDEDLFDDDSAEAIREVDRKIVEMGEADTREVVRHIDGRKHVFLDNKYPYHDDAGEIAGLMGISRDITERKEFEQRLRALQETAQELNLTQGTEEIAELAVEAAESVLDLSVAAIWSHREARDELVPVAESERAREVIGPAPTFEPGDSLAWDVFESGEMQVYSDVSEAAGVHNEETDIGAEILYPLGEYGVMSTSSMESASFSNADTELFRILAATTEAALVRATREERLRRQNDRLDEFTSVVSHDLKNPLDVAQGRLTFACRDCDSEHLEEIGDALDRMESIVEDTLTLARDGMEVEETDRVSVHALIGQCWGMVDPGDASLGAVEEFAIRAEQTRLRHIFENLLRNAVEHGGPDPTVSVATTDDGFYVADDGPGISAAERESVFEPGESSSPEGTGFGLAIVRRMAQAHGWEVAITESEAGGTRFDFTGVELVP